MCGSEKLLHDLRLLDFGWWNSYDLLYNRCIFNRAEIRLQLKHVHVFTYKQMGDPMGNFQLKIGLKF